MNRQPEGREKTYRDTEIHTERHRQIKGHAEEPTNGQSHT